MLRGLFGDGFLNPELVQSNQTESKHDMEKKLKLKPIPENTVVHTPTEAEAKELLEILHENGYEWYHKYSPIPNPNLQEVRYINIYDSLHGCSKVITYRDKDMYDRFLTLAEFKERYVEVEKPRVKVGDKVKINESYYKEELHGSIGIVRCEASPFSFYVEIDNTIYQVGFNDLEPYTEPTEENSNPLNTNDMQKEMDSNENKGLNLCELLKGHEGEKLYSPFYGVMELMTINDGLLCFQNANIGIDLLPNGHSQYAVDGYCAIFPSRALYEQYPLDPRSAWNEWKEAQKKPFICIHWGEVDCNGDEEEDYSGNTYFHTTSDRDKCINENEWKEAQKKPFICIHWGEVDCNGDEEEDYSGNTYFHTTSDRDKCINEIKEVIEKYSK